MVFVCEKKTAQCKKCTRCNFYKPLSLFNNQASHPTGNRSHCRMCSRDSYKVYRQKNLRRELDRGSAKMWPDLFEEIS